MAIVGRAASWPVAQATGKLVKIPLRRGVSVLMYEAEARARGLLPPLPEPEAKAMRPARNKARKAQEDKSLT